MDYYCYDCRKWFKGYDEDLQECPKCGAERGMSFVDKDEYDDLEWESGGGELEQDEEGNLGYHGDL